MFADQREAAEARVRVEQDRLAGQELEMRRARNAEESAKRLRAGLYVSLSTVHLERGEVALPE